MAKIFSTNLLNWLKTKVYMKSEVDVKLDGKSDSNHVHTANSIQFEEGDSGCEYWMEEGYNTQNDVNGILFEAWQKVEAIEDNANKTVVDSSLSATSTNPVENRVVNNALSGKASSTHSHNNASIAMDGFMSRNDKTKLNDIATGATRNIVDSSLSTTSTNPVQNKVLKSQLDLINTNKANVKHTHNDVSNLKRVEDEWGALPVWYMIKNGWCILQWENPMQFLKELNVTPTLKTWFKLGTVPIPQTGRAVYQQLTTGNTHIRIQVTSGGVLNAYMTEDNNWTYGTLVYPTSASV